ncbi:hypothetical protein HID58_046346 [Brassica napus]|uniref:Uncharacterized protein n=1 Tax=Brassica napus TaxID=3708 RepID=A0ABQ8AWC4_BRANA|nr:hypothetical protein HID58_046346 [Brassica napus]
MILWLGKSRRSTLLLLSNGFSSSSRKKQTPPCFVVSAELCEPYEACLGKLVISEVHNDMINLEKKVHLELLYNDIFDKVVTIGASNGWVATLSGDDGILRLQDDLNPYASYTDPKSIPLPPLVTLPCCQTQIVTNVSMSSSSPEDEDCVVAIMPKRQKKQSERGDSSVQTARLSTKGKFRKTDRSHPANREITQQWDIHDDDFYEQMRGVEICPSRFAHRDTTDALGITEDIEALFEKIGMGYIFDLHCDCYADLTRQFLASARLYHPDEDNPVADKAMFSFIVNRQFHSMTIFQLCDVFGFGKGRQSCVPDFPEHNDFWTFIASGNFISREAKQARIRSPTTNELMDSCCTYEHLVESVTTGETFLVKQYKKTVEIDDGVAKMRTEYLMVFKLDGEGNAVHTEDIGDLVIFLSMSEPFCLRASSFPVLFPNSVESLDYWENVTVELADYLVIRGFRPFLAPYLIPPQHID